MKFLDILALVLTIIGGLNWLLIGLLDVNIISLIFSHEPMLARLIFVVIGLAAIYQVVQWKAIDQRWRS